MYKLDLNFKPRSRGFAIAALRLLVAGLAVSFLVQTGLVIRDARRAAELRIEAAALDAEVSRLEARKADLLKTIGNPVVLAGAVKARNDWFRARRRNPVALLSALERNKPRGAELRSFEADAAAGTLRVLSPDTDTAASWLNAAFGNVHGRMTVEDKLPARLSILFAWND